MAEYIPFSERLSLSQVFTRPGIHPQQVPNSVLTLAGVCNGRFPVPDTLCFVDREPNEQQRTQLQKSVVITTQALAQGLTSRALALSEDPRAAFIDLVAEIQAHAGFSALSSLAPVAAGIDAQAFVHAAATIETGVVIGPGCHIAAGCVIKQGTVLLQDVVIRENTVIGCDGIARYAANDGRLLKFPHLAGVLVEAGVEIGASCIIARGALTSTRIGAGSVIGNLCNVGHGVQLGNKTWMSVGCLIGGNCQFGDRVTVGLGVNVRDNLQIGDNASVAMGSAVMRNIAAGESVLGNPAKVVPGIVAGPPR